MLEVVSYRAWKKVFLICFRIERETKIWQKKKKKKRERAGRGKSIRPVCFVQRNLQVRYE